MQGFPTTVEPREAFSLGPHAVTNALTLETHSEKAILVFCGLLGYLHPPQSSVNKIPRRHVHVDYKACLAKVLMFLIIAAFNSILAVWFFLGPQGELYS